MSEDLHVTRLRCRMQAATWRSPWWPRRARSPRILWCPASVSFLTTEPTDTSSSGKVSTTGVKPARPTDRPGTGRGEGALVFPPVNKLNVRRSPECNTCWSKLTACVYAGKDANSEERHAVLNTAESFISKMNYPSFTRVETHTHTQSHLR